ncbi:HsdM family class I SAM-dependent methyltransferase [Marivita cryptomonadis]|uniref:site-specific DNA-methyltransferase (adenine-specific) n=2 Tax=Roseobacteraceae TaxID=2854170 RepID=A0A9Q2PCJ4_9RHOB|nr:MULTISPECIES: class I SAM-dependent DNA methyltransferase [Marivita]MCR9168199.1 type I restriction-modification system subunit M [Paracoccaceae bacterium]MBM2323036.1 SAM-dependent DNA methyltransferase [Marivita cryptomonadis]MBM2332619.1 SAM-dependent DNA methyltransferase [Marivita cryptomonadis]MBM2342202.1 SAM-dependent DNA methyltransferase [Marivita cryptomonadis]MBM2346867.1 SAM-dependent DNA methyltransferase [Marivita cryptomonadis]
MITGELKSKVENIWNAMWTGGISNPQTVMEQLTLLLFLKGLDDAQTLAERQARARGVALERDLFPDDLDGIPIVDDQGVKVADGRAYSDLRWPRFTTLPPAEMQEAAENHLIPFLRRLGSDGAPLRKHMASARYEIPTGRLLAKVVDLVSDLPMKSRDTKGDLYEYMLSKVAAAGQNGQFRTPRHIIELLVAMTEPRRDDVICDPACGTAGFLVGAAEYLRRNDADAWTDPDARSHIESGMFHGHDFDGTMLRLGAMNMALHGFEDASIVYRDSLTQEHGDEAETYSLILANPPFAGSLDAEVVAKDLTRIVNTRKTELLFMALFLRLLKRGGRAAVVVPDGVLFGSNKAHKEVRRILVEEQQLQGVLKLPAGVFRPYAGVSTAILLFQRTDSGGTDGVWFYDMHADGLSLDDKRNFLVPEDKLGPWAELAEDEAKLNDLPDALSRWKEREGTEKDNPRTARSFVVPKEEIAAAGYDLSLNRYREIEHDVVEHERPATILKRLRAMELEICTGLDALEAMLGDGPAKEAAE